MEKRVVIGVSVALICVILVAVASWVFFSKGELSEETYLSVCSDEGFKSYSQEVTEESTAGIVKGYISTLLSHKMQLDFYEFENEEFTESAFNRLKDWIFEQYGKGGVTETFRGRTTWVYETEDIYCKAVMDDNKLVYIFSSDPATREEAILIIDRVTDG